MQEYVSDAVVLNAEPNGNMDTRFSLFTKRFGKLKPKAKSARKITSKLSPHLQAGNVAKVRLIEKNGLQIVDALKQFSLAASPSALYLFDQIVGEGEPDEALWNALVRNDFQWTHILTLLGWSPSAAQCVHCGARDPAAFHIRTQEFFCNAWALKFPKNEVIFIK